MTEHTPRPEAKDLESFEETLAVLSDPELMAAIREADAEVTAGGAVRLSKQEALAEIHRRG
jgi:PHD/YefM family antitoxin component YafN of YafNO toxin-antitoxin module